MLLSLVLAVVAGVIVTLIVWTVGEWLEKLSQS